jgi:hypothetical protein
MKDLVLVGETKRLPIRPYRVATDLAAIKIIWIIVLLVNGFFTTSL